jgi:hypothetical protein
VGPMTPGELHAWIKRRKLKHEEAAKLLGLSREGLRKNLYGVTPIGRQTEIIVEQRDKVEKWTGGER